MQFHVSSPTSCPCPKNGEIHCSGKWHIKNYLKKELNPWAGVICEFKVLKREWEKEQVVIRNLDFHRTSKDLEILERPDETSWEFLAQETC